MDQAGWDSPVTQLRNPNGIGSRTPHHSRAPLQNGLSTSSNHSNPNLQLYLTLPGIAYAQLNILASVVYSRAFVPYVLGCIPLGDGTALVGSRLFVGYFP